MLMTSVQCLLSFVPTALRQIVVLDATMTVIYYLTACILMSCVLWHVRVVSPRIKVSAIGAYPFVGVALRQVRLLGLLEVVLGIFLWLPRVEHADQL